MNVKTAFLYRVIDQLLFVEIPKDYYNDLKNMVCKFDKALYGLKPSPQLWYKRLSSFFLKKLGPTCIKANYSIFITSQGLEEPILSIFVNDIKIIGFKNTRVIVKVQMI